MEVYSVDALWFSKKWLRDIIKITNYILLNHFYLFSNFLGIAISLFAAFPFFVNCSFISRIIKKNRNLHLIETNFEIRRNKWCFLFRDWILNSQPYLFSWIDHNNSAHDSGSQNFPNLCNILDIYIYKI